MKGIRKIAWPRRPGVVHGVGDLSRIINLSADGRGCQAGRRKMFGQHGGLLKNPLWPPTWLPHPFLKR